MACVAGSTRVLKPKARGYECTLGPSVANGSEVPLDRGRCCVFRELVLEIDERLHRRDVHVVDSAEVKDHGAQDRPRRQIFRHCLATARSRVVPWTVLYLGVSQIQSFPSEL